jgi:hypothetical protein
MLIILVKQISITSSFYKQTQILTPSPQLELYLLTEQVLPYKIGTNDY